MINNMLFTPISLNKEKHRFKNNDNNYGFCDIINIRIDLTFTKDEYLFLTYTQIFINYFPKIIKILNKNDITFKFIKSKSDQYCVTLQFYGKIKNLKIICSKYKNYIKTNLELFVFIKLKYEWLSNNENKRFIIYSDVYNISTNLQQYINKNYKYKFDTSLYYNNFNISIKLNTPYILSRSINNNLASYLFNNKEDMILTKLCL